METSEATALITIQDLDDILSEIEKLTMNAPKLLISHELKYIKDPQVKAFKILVSSIISLRVKEAVTWDVSQRLYERVKNFKDMAEIPTNELEAIVFKAGFYRRKSQQLKEIAQIILCEYKGMVPDDLEVLLTLPGVGRKVANLVVTEAFDKEGICVDTHVHRISNRWGLVETNHADKTEMALRKILPRKYWRIYNQRLVQFGQNICLPVGPKCKRCFLCTKCPSAQV